MASLLLCSAPAAAQDAPGPDPAALAAESFGEGQQLYQQGKYREAIRAFERANVRSPHPSAQFNIARCYENLGKPSDALKFYRLALGRTTEAGTRKDIVERIARLEALPVKVFVTSRPRGGVVTVGGRPKPENGRTPLSLQLKPGAHLLLARVDGHELAARRVVVQVGTPQQVEIVLKKKPVPTVAPVSGCHKDEPPELETLHVHGAVLGAIGLALGRPLLAAPGVRLYASLHKWLFGGHLLYFPVGEESIAPISLGAETYTNAKFRSILAQAEGGRAITWGRARVELTAGLGASVDRVIFASKTSEAELVREASAFSWSLGAALKGTVTRWLLVGVAARFGLIHGDRVDKDDPEGIDDRHHIPYLTFWGSLSVQL